MELTEEQRQEIREKQAQSVARQAKVAKILGIPLLIAGGAAFLGTLIMSFFLLYAAGTVVFADGFMPVISELGAAIALMFSPLFDFSTPMSLGWALVVGAGAALTIAIGSEIAMRRNKDDDTPA